MSHKGAPQTSTSALPRLWCPDCSGSGEDEWGFRDDCSGDAYDPCPVCKGMGSLPVLEALDIHAAVINTLFSTGGRLDTITRWQPHPAWPAPVDVRLVAFVGTDADDSERPEPWWGDDLVLTLHVRCSDGAEYDLQTAPEDVVEFLEEGADEGYSVPVSCNNPSHRLAAWPTVVLPTGQEHVHIGPHEHCGCGFLHVWDEQCHVDEFGNVRLRVVYGIGDYNSEHYRPCEHGLFAFVPPGESEPVQPHEHLAADYLSTVSDGVAVIKHVGAVHDHGRTR